MKERYIDVVIEEGKTAYEAVEKYIYRFLGHEGYDDVIVRLGTSYNNVEWDIFNEFVSIDVGDLECVFEDDWWEGERFIRIYGIQSIQTLNISGGLYYD